MIQRFSTQSTLLLAINFPVLVLVNVKTRKSSRAALRQTGVFSNEIFGFVGSEKSLAIVGGQAKLFLPESSLLVGGSQHDDFVEEVSQQTGGPAIPNGNPEALDSKFDK